MPIISKVGRNSIRIRTVITSLYVLLSLGAVTMIYPFIIMLSTSITSQVDQYEFRVLPHYLYNDETLFRKYLESKYNERIGWFNLCFGTDFIKFSEVAAPVGDSQKPVTDWQEFKKTLPLNFKCLVAQSTLTLSVTSPAQRRYIHWLKKKYHGDLEALNRNYGERYTVWHSHGGPGLPYDYFDEGRGVVTRFRRRRDRKLNEFLEFKKLQPEYLLMAVPMDGVYQRFLTTRYGKSIEVLNQRYGTDYRKVSQIYLLPGLPVDPRQAEDWEEFVRNECPFEFIRVDLAARKFYQEFLTRKYESDISLFNRDYGTAYVAFSEIDFPKEPPREGFALNHWTEFISREVPIEFIAMDTPQTRYLDFLRQRYGRIEDLNGTYGSEYRKFDEVQLPYLEAEWKQLKESKGRIRFEFVIRNYREASSYLLLHGRAFLNTGVLCLAMVVMLLTVNPLAAYALSRFNPPGTYKILLFLLATMAFPPAVTMIPAFLLVKNLGLLNTYWALILPIMANGFSIFLLKGFFDSLPEELYEAALIDGAREHQMFWHIALSLSKPILAVIALQGFTSAYSMFMFALLLCQDQKMWTLMVWLYEMSQWAPTFVMFAALVLAAIPTLLVFIFCQNIIMRGIILPIER